MAELLIQVLFFLFFGKMGDFQLYPGHFDCYLKSLSPVLFIYLFS